MKNNKILFSHNLNQLSLLAFVDHVEGMLVELQTLKHLLHRREMLQHVLALNIGEMNSIVTQLQ